MAFNAEIADRVLKVLEGREGLTERKMFGGIAFMLNGNMCCGVNGTDVMVRLGKDGALKALSERHIREMDFTGTPLSTMVYLLPAGYRKDEDLKRWLKRAINYAKTLPPK